jgi:hypothetical protein
MPNQTTAFKKQYTVEAKRTSNLSNRDFSGLTLLIATWLLQPSAVHL